MAIWKEIKKALNSTIGTTGFKSLDNLLLDNLGEYFFEKNSQTLLSKTGKTVNSALAADEYNTYDKDAVVGNFVPKYSGTVTVDLAVVMKGGIDITGDSVYVSVFDATTKTLVGSGKLVIPSNNAQTLHVVCDLPVEKMKNYEVALAGWGSISSATWFSASQFTIKGTKKKFSTDVV